MDGLQVAAFRHRVGTAVPNLPAYPPAAGPQCPRGGECGPGLSVRFLPHPPCRLSVLGDQQGLQERLSPSLPGACGRPRVASAAPPCRTPGGSSPLLRAVPGSWCWQHLPGRDPMVPQRARSLGGRLCPLCPHRAQAGALTVSRLGRRRERSGFQRCFPSQVRGLRPAGSPWLAASARSQLCLLCLCAKCTEHSIYHLTICKCNSEASDTLTTLLSHHRCLYPTFPSSSSTGPCAHTAAPPLHSLRCFRSDGFVNRYFLNRLSSG